MHSINSSSIDIICSAEALLWYVISSPLACLKDYLVDALLLLYSILINKYGQNTLFLIICTEELVSLFRTLFVVKL